MDPLTMKINTYRPFDTPVPVHQVTWHSISEHLNFQREIT